MSLYNPDRWVLIKIGGINPHYRVFGCWSGGYLDGDSWRMNSGIVRVEEDEENYRFYGSSGSCYVCGKYGYGYTFYGYRIAKSYEDKGGELFRIIEEEPKDIMNMDWIIGETTETTETTDLDTIINAKNISRLEVIEETGRAYVKYLDLEVEELNYSLQDNGRTLKVFVSKL